MCFNMVIETGWRALSYHISFHHLLWDRVASPQHVILSHHQSQLSRSDRLTTVPSVGLFCWLLCFPHQQVFKYAPSLQSL